MKSSFRRALLLGALLPVLNVCVVACAHALPMLPIKADEVTDQEITKTLDTATMDAYLIDLGRAANINVIADATDFPANSPTVPYPATPGAIAGVKGENRQYWKADLLRVVGDFVTQKKLSTLRSGERTFLFWSEPDPIALIEAQISLMQAAEDARFAEAVAAQKAAGVPDEEIISGELDREQLRRVLIDYFKNERGWTYSEARKNEKLDISIPMDELPPVLRALVLSQLQRTGIVSGQLQKFQPDFWTSDALRVSVDKSGDSNALLLTRPVKGENGRTSDAYQYKLAQWKGTEIEAAPLALPEIAGTGTTPGAQLMETEFDATTMERVYGGISDQSADPIPDASPALQKEISLEVKRLPLRELVAQLQAQSGVTLSLASNAPADKLLTARVEKMPLVTFMKTLSRVYGVTWNKTGEAYQMRGNERGELHLKLLQVGDPYILRFIFYNRADRKREQIALARAVVEEVGMEALQTPDAVAFTSLSPMLQAHCKRIAQEAVSEYLATSLYQINALMTQELTIGGLELHLANGVELPLNSGGSVTRTLGLTFNDFRFLDTSIDGPPEMLNLLVSSRDGQLSTRVFFFMSYESWEDQQAPAPGRRRLPVR